MFIVHENQYSVVKIYNISATTKTLKECVNSKLYSVLNRLVGKRTVRSQ